MRRLPAGLARQSLVAMGLSALVIAAAVAERPARDQASVAANQAVDKPILATAIVTPAAQLQTMPIVAPEPAAAAEPTPAIAQLTPTIRATTVKKAGRQACAAPCAKVGATARAKATGPAAPVVVATAAPAPQADPSPPSLRKRLFAPVGFIRENVGRLIQWL